MKKIIVTTSWDDGHKLDIKLAKLLKKYNIKGTFYVAPKNREFRKEVLLSDEEIIQLSDDFEIGAHTMTHSRLTKVGKEEAFVEIIDSKKHLERLLKKEVKSFCYPGGNYNNEIKEMVRKAGFIGARTVRQMVTKFPKNNFESHTTLQALPQNLNLLSRYAIIYDLKIISCLFNRNWDEIAKKSFDYVKKNRMIFHLWGHSWEINNNNDWNKLEEVFEYISNRPDVKYLTNSEMIEVARNE